MKDFDVLATTRKRLLEDEKLKNVYFIAPPHRGYPYILLELTELQTNQGCFGACTRAKVGIKFTIHSQEKSNEERLDILGRCQKMLDGYLTTVLKTHIALYKHTSTVLSSPSGQIEVYYDVFVRG